jgi:CRISPR type I-E-associated protein CasB/Cse2
MAEEEGKKETWVRPLIRSYRGLSTGAKAQLRRLDDYEEVPILAPEAFYTVRKSGEKQLPEQVVSALLILFRDRGAADEIGESARRLGAMFSGDGDMPVKPIRFKRLVAAKDLESGFRGLRGILRLFRHEKVNWEEVAEYLNALFWYEAKQNWLEGSGEKQLRFVRKRLADEYFKKMFSSEK